MVVWLVGWPMKATHLFDYQGSVHWKTKVFKPSCSFWTHSPRYCSFARSQAWTLWLYFHVPVLVVNRGWVKGTTSRWKVSITRVPKDNIQLFTVKDCVLALLTFDPAVLQRFSRTSGGKPEFRPESARGGIKSHRRKLFDLNECTSKVLSLDCVYLKLLQMPFYNLLLLCFVSSFCCPMMRLQIPASSEMIGQNKYEVKIGETLRSRRSDLILHRTLDSNLKLDWWDHVIQLKCSIFTFF